MKLKTEILNFSIGGFSGDYEKVIWKNEKLYHFFERSFFEEDFIIPSTKDKVPLALTISWLDCHSPNFVF